MVKLFQFDLFNNCTQDWQDLHSGFGEAGEMTSYDYAGSLVLEVTCRKENIALVYIVPNKDTNQQ